MKRQLSLAWFIIVAALPFSQTAQAQHAEYDALVAAHARANGVPEALVHRVIVRESKFTSFRTLANLLYAMVTLLYLTHTFSMLVPALAAMQTKSACDSRT